MDGVRPTFFSLADPSDTALYLEKMGDDHLEEALAEMECALAQMLG